VSWKANGTRERRGGRSGRLELTLELGGIKPFQLQVARQQKCLYCSYLYTLSLTIKKLNDGMKGLLNQFSGKRVFITGHTGFKGSWLSYWLQMEGAEVKGYSLAPDTSPNLFESLQLENKIQSVIGNINDYRYLESEILSFKPDFIFHLAAQPLVRASYNDPLLTFQTNVCGTANVLQSLRFLENPCTSVFVTTDKVYQNNEWVYPYRENDRLGGYDPYSASKACSELVISSFKNSYFNIADFASHGKAVASARAGNVIGGGDWSADRLLPDIIRAVTKDEVIVLRNPTAVRPWQHVLEPLYGYLLLALKLSDDVQKFSGSWNFGPSPTDNFSVSELANMAVALWEKGKVTVARDELAPHEAQLLRLDISKATERLKWTPRLDAKKAIERTMIWYNRFYQGHRTESLVQDDLNFYKTLFD
jgi:CDP-glucose 4,6-dehydratase